MAERRFTNWVGSVVSKLAGSAVTTGDRIAIYDASAGTTKYLDPAEIVDIPAVVAALAVAGGGATAENAPVVCVWDGAAWEQLDGAAVPTTATLVRYYDSSDDPAATAPTAYNVHDKWFGI